jgi:hypothetical protein
VGLLKTGKKEIITMERKDYGHEINKLAIANGYNDVWIFPDENKLHCASAKNEQGIRVSIGCGCKGRIALYKEVKQYFEGNTTKGD